MPELSSLEKITLHLLPKCHCDRSLCTVKLARFVKHVAITIAIVSVSFIWWFFLRLCERTVRSRVTLRKEGQVELLGRRLTDLALVQKPVENSKAVSSKNDVGHRPKFTLCRIVATSVSFPSACMFCVRS